MIKNKILKKAIKQSENVIFDLRRLKYVDEIKCLRVLDRYKRLTGLKNLLIIKKDGRLLTEKGYFAIMET